MVSVQPSTSGVQLSNGNTNLSSMSSSSTPSIQVQLQDRELWRTFSNGINNEMIITKAGRRMFPVVRIRARGLEPRAMYNCVLEFVQSDDNKWKYSDGSWHKSGKADLPSTANVYVHADSPNFGDKWMRDEISFAKLKFTNKENDKGWVLLNSMHFYQPVVKFYRIEAPGSIGNRQNVSSTVHGGGGDDDVPQVLVATAVFPECQFIAVTSYQNDEVTELKIKHNPFAKGFQDHHHAARNNVEIHHHQQHHPPPPPPPPPVLADHCPAQSAKIVPPRSSQSSSSYATQTTNSDNTTSSADNIHNDINNKDVHYAGKAWQYGGLAQPLSAAAAYWQQQQQQQVSATDSLNRWVPVQLQPRVPVVAPAETASPMIGVRVEQQQQYYCTPRWHGETTAPTYQSNNNNLRYQPYVMASRHLPYQHRHRLPHATPHANNFSSLTANVSRANGAVAAATPVPGRGSSKSVTTIVGEQQQQDQPQEAIDALLNDLNGIRAGNYGDSPRVSFAAEPQPSPYMLTYGGVNDNSSNFAADVAQPLSFYGTSGQHHHHQMTNTWSAPQQQCSSITALFNEELPFVRSAAGMTNIKTDQPSVAGCHHHHAVLSNAPAYGGGGGVVGKTEEDDNSNSNDTTTSNTNSEGKLIKIQSPPAATGSDL